MVMAVTDIKAGKFYADKKGDVRKVYYVGPLHDWKVGWHGQGGERGLCYCPTFANWAEREVSEPKGWVNIDADEIVAKFLRHSSEKKE